MSDRQVQETPYLEICIWMQKLQSAMDLVHDSHVVKNLLVDTGAIKKNSVGTSPI